MSRILALSLFVIMSTSAPSAIAQDAPDEDAWKALVAYTALISTPAGMLDPTVPEVDARPAGPRFILRYGRLGEPLSGESARLQSVGLHASVPAGRARVEASAGRLFWCEQVERGQVEFERVEDACSGSWAAGLAVAVTVWRVSLDGGPGSLSVGLRPAVGLKLFPEADDDLRALSADVTAPIAVSLGSATKAVFYAAPGVAWGRLRSTRDVSGLGESGFRGLLGFGVAVIGPSGVGVTAGGQKVFFQYGSTQFGAGLIWHPGRR